MPPHPKRPAPPPTRVRVVIEIPRGGFLKRGGTGEVDFVSPFPCPFNYGAIPDWIGCDGDPLDAVVLGPRLRRGQTVDAVVRAAVGMTDRGIPDDKIICSPLPLSRRDRVAILSFFRFYAACKRLLYRRRRLAGATFCTGWAAVPSALARARLRNGRCRPIADPQSPTSIFPPRKLHR